MVNLAHMKLLKPNNRELLKYDVTESKIKQIVDFKWEGFTPVLWPDKIWMNSVKYVLEYGMIVNTTKSTS